jgi:competence ComEA-like helix-hairpin-helix protein
LPDWLSDAGTETTQEESLPAATEEPLSEPIQEEDGKVNINSATLEQLAELPGIGDMLAQTIVAHRETYGDFSSIDDLSNIAGIGPSTVEDLQGQVEVRKVEAAAQADEPGVTDWLREKAEAEGIPAEETGDEDLPSWLTGLDSDVEEKPADEPADEDQGLPEWLQTESEDEAAQPEPTTSKDWQPVEAAESDQVEVEEPAAQAEEEVVREPVAEAPAPEPVEPEPEPEPAPAEREAVTTGRTETTGTLSDVQNPDFTEAQNELTRGNIPAAMEKYGKLIKKGKMLDEIIFDLREALYRYPVEVIILQTLGDAYMRANRLQEALDAYTKAEELLR